MQNFYTANHYELNRKIEMFYSDLENELHNKFYGHRFQIGAHFTSKERPLSLNNIGLKLLNIRPLHFVNDELIKDKDWIWDNDKKDLISKICAKVANNHEFEFVGLNSDRENYPLFVVRVANDDIDKDLLEKYCN